MPDPISPDPATAPPPLPADTSSGIPAPIAAGLAVLFTIVGGIVFLVLERQNRFVRFYAMQGVLLGATAFVAGLCFAVLHIIFGFIPFFGWIVLLIAWVASIVFWLGWVIVYLVAAVKAFTGVEWEIPYIGPMARRQMDQIRF